MCLPVVALIQSFLSAVNFLTKSSKIECCVTKGHNIYVTCHWKDVLSLGQCVRERALSSYSFFARTLKLDISSSSFVTVHVWNVQIFEDIRQAWGGSAGILVRLQSQQGICLCVREHRRERF